MEFRTHFRTCPPFFRGRRQRVLIKFPWPAGTSLILSCVGTGVHPELWVTVGANEKSPILARSIASCVSCAKKNHYPIQPSAQQLSNPLTYWDSTLIITYKYVVNLQFGYTDCTPGPNSGPEIISSSLRHFDYKTTQLDSFSIHIVLCILN